jgi:hypothetical protein
MVRNGETMKKARITIENYPSLGSRLAKLAARDGVTVVDWIERRVTLEEKGIRVV